MTRKARHALVLLLPIALSGCFKTRQEIAREKEEVEVRTSLQQNVVDNGQALERTQAEIGRLQGRIEELEHQRKKEMTGLASSHEAELKTIEELKAKLASMQEGQNALFEEIKKLKEDYIAASHAALQAASAPPKGRKAGASFESGQAAFKARNYPAAEEAFRAYLEANPKGKHTLDARFFLAESMYKQKDYEKAVVEFGMIHEKAPASQLGRKSTLRLAQSFKAMGKNRDAKAFAQLLVQGSPESEEAKAARKLLK